MEKSNRTIEKKNSVWAVIFRTTKEHKALSGGLFCATIGAILTTLLPPLVLARIIDGITREQGLSAMLILSYFGFLACTGLLEATREALLTVFGQKMTHALRSSLMEKFTNLTTEGITRQEPGVLVSRFIGDVDTVENLFTSGIVSMVADSCKIISILVVIRYRNPGLALLLVLLLPGIFAFTRYVQKNTLAAEISNRKAVARASGHVPETLHNIRTVHCLGKERYMKERYDGYITDSYRALEKTNFYDSVYSPVILILNAVVVAMIMMLSASGNSKVLMFFGMSAGTAVAVMNYISQIFAPVESLGMEIQTIQTAMAGIHRINEFFEMEEIGEIEERAPNSGENIERKVPLLEFDYVTFGYDEHIVLKDMTFRVEEGEQVTLSGRTGAGKSTIFKLLLGLYSPEAGEVLVSGIPATKVPPSEKRKWFGYVEQSYHMVPGTVAEQITLYDESVSREQVKRAARLAGLDSEIETLEEGYDTRCVPELFSQGQWQLLSIARAIVAEPKILLLDEITANLDAETEHQVMQALKRASEKRTVVAISHRVSGEMGRVTNI